MWVAITKRVVVMWGGGGEIKYQVWSHANTIMHSASTDVHAVV